MSDQYASIKVFLERGMKGEKKLGQELGCHNIPDLTGELIYSRDVSCVET